MFELQFARCRVVVPDGMSMESVVLAPACLECSALSEARLLVCEAFCSACKRSSLYPPCAACRPFDELIHAAKFISENTLQEDVRVNDILAVQDEATKHNAESTMRFDMVFKAKLFLSHMWDELDVNAINLYFLQAMYDITNDLMPLAEPQAMQVAALQLHNLYPGALPPTSELV